MNERKQSYLERIHATHLLIQDTLHDGSVLLVTSNADIHEHNKIGDIKPSTLDTQSCMLSVFVNALRSYIRDSSTTTKK